MHTKKVTFVDFKGIMAPVFTCFEDNENFKLDVSNIKTYAAWLKSKHIIGVLVNSVSGEGPSLGLSERKLNAEKWLEACHENNLISMVQVGGAPLPDVLELAHHAETIGIHAVLCLPELFYKPTNVDNLVSYCQAVAKKCSTRPFFYYHIPRYTGVDLDMSEFCNKAEETIPNFFGLQFSSPDLDMAVRCNTSGRVILLGYSSLLLAGYLLGFESVMLSICNIRPDLCNGILAALKKFDVQTAQAKQTQLTQLIRKKLSNMYTYNIIKSEKQWFNEEMAKDQGAKFSAGPIRKLY